MRGLRTIQDSARGQTLLSVAVDDDRQPAAKRKALKSVPTLWQRRVSRGWCAGCFCRARWMSCRCWEKVEEEQRGREMKVAVQRRSSFGGWEEVRASLCWTKGRQARLCRKQSLRNPHAIYKNRLARRHFSRCRCKPQSKSHRGHKTRPLLQRCAFDDYNNNQRRVLNEQVVQAAIRVRLRTSSDSVAINFTISLLLP